MHGTVVGIPPFREACLAGACPIPDDKTFPRITSSTYLGLKLIDSNAPLIATPPSSGA